MGPSGWTRRAFLQAVGMGVAGGALVGTLGDSLIPGDVHEAFAGAPIGPNDGILITIMLYGGNDGLNTVIPYANGLYYQQRANIAVPQNQVLAINNNIGLHPNLPYVRSLFGSGQVAIVQGVGYDDPDLSHFTSMAIWMNAKYGPGAASQRLDRPVARRSVGGRRRARCGHDRLVGAACTCSGCQRRAVGISPWGDMFGAEVEPRGPAHVRRHQGDGQRVRRTRAVARHVRVDRADAS